MSLMKLEIPAMISISEPWVNPEKDRQMLEDHALTAGLVPILAREHNELLRARLSRFDTEGTLKALSEMAAILDKAHDEAYRTLHGMLVALAMMSDEKRRAQLDEIRELLMPQGAGDIQMTYLADSGTIEQVVPLMTPEMEALLTDIVVDGRSLMQLFEEWVDAGRRLDDVERERAQLEDLQARESRVTGREIQKIRYRWIGAVNALIALLDLDSDITEDCKTRILQPLRHALAKHMKHSDDFDGTDTEQTAQNSAEPGSSRINSVTG